MGRFFVYLFFSFLYISLCAQNGENDVRNPYVKYKVTKTGGLYNISYTFKDINSRLLDVKLSLEQKTTDFAIDKFGVPGWFLKPYSVDKKTILRRKKIMRQGLFKQEGSRLLPDYSAMIQYYRPFVRPVAKLIRQILSGRNADNERNRIELAMRFVQDIPYAVPPDRRGGKITSGVFSPPEILINGYGDCDSKVILFIGILSYLIDPERIVILRQKNHLLSAVRENPKDGEIFVRYRGKKYLIAETAGTGHFSLGEKGDYFSSSFSIIPLSFPDE